MCFSEKVNQSESTWVAARNLEDRKTLSKEGSVELLGTVKTWGDDLKDGSFKRNSQYAADKQSDWVVF